MQFLIDLLKSILKEPAVRVAIVGAIVNALLYLWSFLASKFPGLPDPAAIFFEIGAWIELFLTGWAASRVKAAYVLLRAGWAASREAYVVPRAHPPSK